MICRLPGGEGFSGQARQRVRRPEWRGGGRQCGQGWKKEDGAPLRWLGSVPASGPAQGRPQGPFSCVGAAGATECNGDGDFYVFYVCFAYDKMPQSLLSGSLGASWELPQPDLLCHSLKGAWVGPFGERRPKGPGYFPKATQWMKGKVRTRIGSLVPSPVDIFYHMLLMVMALLVMLR